MSETHEKVLTVKKKGRGGRDIMKTKQKQGKVAKLTYSDTPNCTSCILAKCLKSSLDLYIKSTPNAITMLESNYVTSLQ